MDIALIAACAVIAALAGVIVVQARRVAALEAENQLAARNNVELAAELMRVEAKLTRLTDRDEKGRFKKAEVV